MNRLLKSSKFWAAVLGLAVVILVEALGVNEEAAGQIQAAVLTLIGLFIGATAIEDAAKKLKGGK